ncbi:MAG: hypothetical protein ABFD50_15745, partial [Smithella sp.]
DDDRIDFPFTSESASKIIESISMTKVLTPRRLMVYFDHVLSQCLLDQDPPEDGFSLDNVQSYLCDPELGSLDTDMPE